jgi:hypothetical protein
VNKRVEGGKMNTTTNATKKNGRQKRRGMLALSLLLIAALVIPQAALAANPTDNDVIAVNEPQSPEVLGNDGGGGALLMEPLGTVRLKNL